MGILYLHCRILLTSTCIGYIYHVETESSDVSNLYHMGPIRFMLHWKLVATISTIKTVSSLNYDVIRE